MINVSVPMCHSYKSCEYNSARSLTAGPLAGTTSCFLALPGGSHVASTSNRGFAGLRMQLVRTKSALEVAVSL